MGREATGELRTLADGYAARITIAGRTRQDFMLLTCVTEAEALERCKALATMASRLRRAGKVNEIVRYVEQGAKARAGRAWEFVVGGVDIECDGRTKDKGGPALVPMFTTWAKDWTSGALAKKYPDHVKAKRSADRDEDLLRVYVLPHLVDVRIDQFTLEHAELVMASIPPHLAAGTRRLIAHTMARLTKLAVYPGKWRKDNPIPAGWLPRVGDPKAKECLYPDEDALLMGGVSVPEVSGPDVPVLRRLAYGFLAREGMRTDEMANLRWSDVDLKRGRVNLDENKTDDPRDWNLRPDVVEALARWKKLSSCAEGNDHVFAENGIPINTQHLADQLRRDLRRVGVTRSQLFERSKARQPLRAHDLRATFVTIALAQDRSETWIGDRTGHKSHKMINAYRRKARSWDMGELGPLCDLIPELHQAASRSAPAVANTPRLPHAAAIQANSQVLNRKCIPEVDTEDSRATEETRHSSDPRSAEIAPPMGSRGNAWGNGDPIETALADALTKATAAQQWDVVARLASELEARRGARAKVLSLPQRRRA